MQPTTGLPDRRQASLTASTDFDGHTNACGEITARLQPADRTAAEAPGHRQCAAALRATAARISAVHLAEIERDGCGALSDDEVIGDLEDSVGDDYAEQFRDPLTNPMTTAELGTQAEVLAMSMGREQ